jgi:antitoxin component YwqK of YwqJK toxin-antitoxin module
MTDAGRLSSRRSSGRSSGQSSGRSSGRSSRQPSRRRSGWLAVVPVYAAAHALGACATPRTVCPFGTELARQIYSGGAEVEWCGRPDGVRLGPETRYYESGRELASGAYVDGAQSGVWRYRFNDGRNWRAERWEDGALIQKTIDPAVARMSPAELEALGPTSSGIIKLASHDPQTGRQARDLGSRPFVSYFDSGRPRAAGSFDPDGLRVGIWRFWFDDGHPAREVQFLGGVREGPVREWFSSGGPAVEGSYLAGERNGRWRFWDPRGQISAEILYVEGARVWSLAGPAATDSPPPGGGMLPGGP